MVVRGHWVTGALTAVVVLAAVVVGALAAVSPRLAVAATACLCAAAVAYAHPRLALLAGVAIFPILPGLQRGLVVPGARITELVAIGFGLLALQRVRRRPLLPVTPVEWLVLAFVAGSVMIGAVNLVAHDITADGDALGKVVGPIQFALALFGIRVLVLDADDLRDVLRVIVLASVPVAVVAVLQFLDAPGVRDLVITLTGSETAPVSGQTDGVRATGLFSHWHSLGGYLCFILILVVALLFRDPPLPRWMLAGVLAIDLAALLCTVTFAPIGGALLGILIIATLHRRLLVAAGGMLVAAAVAAPVALPALTERLGDQFQDAKPVYQIDQASYPLLPQTVGFRIQVWVEQYAPAMKQYLFTGWGTTIPPGVRWEYTESVYLTLIVRGGLLLLTIYLALMTAVFVLSWRLRRDHPRPALPEAMAVAIAVFALMQVINPYFTDAGFPQLWWLTLGVLLSPAFRTVPTYRPSLEEVAHARR